MQEHPRYLINKKMTLRSMSDGSVNARDPFLRAVTMGRH